MSTAVRKGVFIKSIQRDVRAHGCVPPASGSLGGPAVSVRTVRGAGEGGRSSEPRAGDTDPALGEMQNNQLTAAPPGGVGTVREGHGKLILP